MSQHYPASRQPGKAKKPRHKKSQSTPATPNRVDRTEDRPAYDRTERSASYQRPERPNTYDRTDRSNDYRDDRSNAPARDDRSSGYTRTERPAYKRTDRPERNGYVPAERPSGDRTDRNGYVRAERPSGDRTDRNGYVRAERSSGDRTERNGYVRAERSNGFDRRDGRERDERTARLERETPGFEDLGEVDSDNGFAALGVAPRLVQRLARDGISAPFPIQAATIPDAIAGRDVLGRGRTGSGKTLGFGLPLLMRLAGGRNESRRPRGLVLVPTRELAMQVHDALEPLAHVLNVRLKLIAGGLPYPKQIEALRRGVDLVIATPGRLIDLCEQGAADLGAVEITVLDEADHMCDLGFLPDVTRLLDMTPQGGQRLLFSATLDGGVDTIVKSYLSDPVTHSTDEARAAVTTMEHHLLVIEPGHKQSMTAELASRDGRTLVFVRTKLGADRVATQLRERGVLAAALHGGLTQGARNRTLGQFKSGAVPVLVATDVAARGIHVDDVGLVIQADPAADHKDYLHRAGRTARAGENGAVVTLVLPHQRRSTVRLAETAGVDAAPVKACPGDSLVTQLTEGAKPTGRPVALPPEPRRTNSRGPHKNRRPTSRHPRKRG